MDQPKHMLSYWVNKKGVEEALRDYYPDLVASDPVLRIGLEQLHAATFMLEARIKQIESESEDEE